MTVDRNALLGTGFQYPFTFDGTTGGATQAAAVDSVRASLRRLFDTAPGEERFNPGYGCGLKTLLFENDTVTLRALCDTVIRDAVRRWEPRIAEIVDLTVEADADNAPNIITIRVFFRLIKSQAVENFVYPFHVQG